MNNYIIDPAIFYWINTLGLLQTVMSVISFFLGVGFIICLVGFIYNTSEAEEYTENERYAKVFKKWMIVSGIICVICMAAAIFIPGKTTSIEMLIAKTATFDNVNWSVQQVKEIVDYVVNAVKGI